MATTRPRGFIENWEPRPQTVALIGAVSSILDENSDILPLTLRQIFYMLVSNFDFDKTEQAYQRLCETMNRARRARWIPMETIRDDGLRRAGGAGWDSEEDFVSSIVVSAEGFELDRQDGQSTRLMLWCEAGGMLPQLASAAEPYHIPVLSSGGFDSVTTKHDMGREISNMGDVEILHIGDHDPSGVHLYYSLDEDLQAFVDYYGGEVRLTRLAVTPEQVADMGLPTSPPKRTDNRSFSGLTTQAEAIPPRTLREIVIAAIDERLDREAYDAVLEEEAEIRERLTERFEGLE